jgi:acetyl-CoA/propionyl-CoA carboxylase biotin carboxyl carrier protein
MLGVRTNLEFLGDLLADPDVVAGRLDTELVDRELPRLLSSETTYPPTGLAVYGLLQLAALQPETSSGVVDPWAIPSGWRVGEHRPLLLRVDPRARATGEATDDLVEIRVWGTPVAARVQVGDGPVWSASLRPGEGPSEPTMPAGTLLVTVDGVTRRWLHATAPDPANPTNPISPARRIWLNGDGRTWEVAAAAVRLRQRAESDGAAEVRSPMPGVVLAVQVAEGDEVQAGQSLIVVEAMKMEHAVTAARAGRVGELLVAVGDHVALQQPLAFIHSAEASREAGIAASP